MPGPNRNSCRVCLGEGIRTLVNGSDSKINSDMGSMAPKGYQYDRLAEKLRFVSMLPISDSNPFMPNMLCYNCIIQLNMAYNFKNIVIETHMYLERLAIENGETGGVLTPVTNCLADDDQASLRSSALPNELGSQMSSPPPMSSTTSYSPPNRNLLIQTLNEPMTSGSESEEVITIKTEPIDERELIMQSAIMDLMRMQSARSKSRIPASIEANLSKKQGTSKGSSTLLVVKPTTSLKRPRQSEPTAKPNPSTPKRPMVAVHKEIDKSRKSDREYLDNVLDRMSGDRTNKRKSARLHRETESSDNALQPETDAPKRMEMGLMYDMNNSKSIRDIMENQPKGRLRTRRTSLH